jgi:hypothetical protein
MGTQSVAFRTRVGDQLMLSGDLATFTQAYDVTVSAAVDATRGLHASVHPAQGYEGLDLQLGDGTGEPVDLEVPTAVIVPGATAGPSGWHSADVPLTVHAADGDGSGIKSITSVVGSGAPVVTPGSTAPVTVSAEGQTTVSAWATDFAGNTSEVVMRTVRLDKTAPLLTVPGETAVTPGVVTYAVSASDAHDAAPVTSCAPASGSVFPAGRTTVRCTATDHVGHTSAASFDVVAAQAVQEPDLTPAQRLAQLQAALAAMDLQQGKRHRLATSLKQIEMTLTDPMQRCARVAKLVTAVGRSGLDAPDEQLLLIGAQELGALLGC